MTQIRVRYKKLGGHIHCRLFIAPGQGLTFAKCGDLVFDEKEWPDVIHRLSLANIELINEAQNDA